MNICFDTFGCRLNRAEALEEEAQAIAKGHRIVKSHGEADLIVIRGCAVTGKAQHDCETEIKRLKEKYPYKRIWVTGCLPGAKPLVIKDTGGGQKAKVPTRTARAYLKIQDGCNSACTYCTVPKYRGKSKPLEFDGIIARAKEFLEAGYHEIVVTGCNLCQHPQFPEIVEALCELSPDCRIRLGSVEPGAMAYKIVDLMKVKPNLCRYLHLSIQSGSQNVLTAMHRPYGTKELDKLIAYALKEVPNLGLGCDMIAGFPGESELDHRQSTGLFIRHKIVHAHVFPYSERPGTVAAVLPRQVPTEVRRARAREMAKTADLNHRRFKRRFLNKETEVVVETKPGDKSIGGWTGEYLWCECVKTAYTKQRPADAKTGYRKLKIRVMVTEVTDQGLKGKIL